MMMIKRMLAANGFHESHQQKWRFLYPLFRLSLRIAVLVPFCLPGDAFGTDFSVITFGAVGDGHADDGPAIQRTVDAATRSSGTNKVLIPAGKYFLGPDFSHGNAQIQIKAAHDLTIVGTKGTELLSGAPQRHIFSVQDSFGIHISSLILDRRPLLFSQGIISAIDVTRKTAIVHIDQSYDPLDSPIVRPENLFIVFVDPNSGTWGDHSAACAIYKPGDSSVCWPPSIQSRRLVHVGDWEVTLNMSPQQNEVGKHVLIWSGIYKGHAFFIQRSHDVFISDVMYYGRGGEGGFIVNHSQGTISFQNFTIGIPQHSNDLIAADSGGMLFNNRANFIFSRANISHVWDDPINIGANYARVYQQPSSTEIRVDGSRADFKNGDLLSIWDWTKKSEILRSHIVGLNCSNAPISTCAIKLDHPVTIAHPGFAPVKSKDNDNDKIDRVIDLDGVGILQVVDSNFLSLHARCILIKASRSVVENSTCSNTVMAGIMIGPQFFWDEGPEADNVTIRDNKFQDVSGANILVTNGGSLQAPMIQGLSITGNQFVDFGRYQHGVDVESGYPILLQNVLNPDINDNRMSTIYLAEHPPVVGHFDSNFRIK